jgi:hypothetical protein
MLMLAGFATVVTETLRVDDGTFTVERLRITETGRRAIVVDRTWTGVLCTGRTALLRPALASYRDGTVSVHDGTVSVHAALAFFAHQDSRAEPPRI